MALIRTPRPPHGFPLVEGVDLTAGRIAGQSNVHKFGANNAIPTTFTPVVRGGLWQTPQVSGATTLRVKAGNAADTAAGAGAREVTLVGLDQTGAEITVTVATAGDSASSATSETFLRLFRAHVSAAGTYATLHGATSGSMAADIVIETTGDTAWATIPLNVFGMAQTTIGCYTVPLGKVGYMKSWLLQVDSNKAVDFMFYVRENILESAVPYSALRMKFGAFGVADILPVMPATPAGPYAALTDLIWMARVGATTGIAAVDFELIIENA